MNLKAIVMSFSGTTIRNTTDAEHNEQRRHAGIFAERSAELMTAGNTGQEPRMPNNTTALLLAAQAAENALLKDSLRVTMHLSAAAQKSLTQHETSATTAHTTKRPSVFNAPRTGTPNTTPTPTPTAVSMKA